MEKIGSSFLAHFGRLVQGIIQGGGEYHCALDFLFDWFGLVCFANKNKNC
jgi:hypothetical protein